MSTVQESGAMIAGMTTFSQSPDTSPNHVDADDTTEESK